MSSHLKNLLLDRPLDWPHWHSPLIAWDSGWYNPSGNIANHEDLVHNLGVEPDFVMFWGRGTTEHGIQILAGQVDFQAGPFGHRIIEQTANRIRTHGVYNRIYLRSWDSVQNQSVVFNSAYRLLALSKTPGYDSGWTAIPGMTQTITKAHGLGVVPDFYALEIGNSAAGSVDRGYNMSGVVSYNQAYCPNVVDYDATNIWIRIQDCIADYYDYSNTARLPTSAAGWYYRLKAWNWAPSYTSSWINITTSDRVRLIKHDLGQIPFLYLLEFSKAADGSDDIVPLMSTGVRSADPDCYATSVVHMGDRYATILGGYSYLAAYIDKTGNGQSPQNAYVRLKCWV